LIVYGVNRALMTAVMAAIGITLCATAYGQETTNVQETVITSDSLMFDYGRSTCVFEGNVVVTEPRVKLKCAKLYVFFDATNNVDSVVATDSVRVTQDNKRGTCDKAVYTAKTGAIVMTGNATLHRARDSVSGDEITIYVDSEKVTCTPGRLVVFPSTIQKAQQKPER
jgi:lipopolysaccharide export system protein LptA